LLACLPHKHRLPRKAWTGQRESAFNFSIFWGAQLLGSQQVRSGLCTHGSVLLMGCYGAFAAVGGERRLQRIALWRTAWGAWLAGVRETYGGLDGCSAWRGDERRAHFLSRVYMRRAWHVAFAGRRGSKAASAGRRQSTHRRLLGPDHCIVSSGCRVIGKQRRFGGGGTQTGRN